MAQYLTCTQTSLQLHYSMASLPAGLRRTVETWLTEHGINPHTLDETAPVIRDEADRVVMWQSIDKHGNSHPHTRRSRHERQTVWPAAFPDRLTAKPSRAPR